MAPTRGNAYHKPVDLSPTIKAQLEGLLVYLEDPEVREILVAGPDRVFVTKGHRPQRVDVSLSERRIRALADRLIRVFRPRPVGEHRPVQMGRISDDTQAVLVGSSSGEGCPLIRLIHQAALPVAPEARSPTDAGRAQAVRSWVAGRRSVVFAGPHGVRAHDWVTTVGAAWMQAGRVALIEAEGGLLAGHGIGHVTLTPEQGVEAALAVAADVIIVPEPFPQMWAALTQAGRPFVAAIEAPEPPAALARLVAWILAGASDLSRVASEALVAAMIDRIVVPMAPTDTAMAVLDSQWRPVIDGGALRLEQVPWPSRVKQKNGVHSEEETSSDVYFMGALGGPLADAPTKAGAWAEREASRFSRLLEQSADPDRDTEESSDAKAAALALDALSADPEDLSTTTGPASNEPRWVLQDMGSAGRASLEEADRHALRATMAAPAAEMLSGSTRAVGANMPTVEASAADLRSLRDAVPRQPIPESKPMDPSEFDGERTPVGSMFGGGRRDESSRPRRPRRPDPRRRRR